jgi:NitT/TauT family transport system substrate-binding protein
MDRRRSLGAAAACLASLAAPALRANTAKALPAVLATPGPGSSVSAIPELAQRIGADQAEGVALRLKFTGGGGVAIREILAGNAQFGVFGISAAMNENLAGPRLVAIAAVEDRAPLCLLVRSALQGSVKRVADLRGRTVGVHSNSLATTTNAQQLLRLLLRREGVPAEEVRQVAAGQSYETQAAALRSGLADAVIAEEPFGLRLEQDGLAHALLRIGLPDRHLGLPGEGFLRGTLITTPALVERDPKLAERIVRVVQRTLAWRRGRSADEIVHALGLSGAEAAAFGAMLGQYPRQFSADGRFSEAQLAETDTFFRESGSGTAAERNYRAATMLVDRWAGRRP